MAADASKSTQEVIDAFWKANLGATNPPDKPFSVLPDNVYAKLERQRAAKGLAQGASVTQSYFDAVKDAEAKVAQIVAECKRNNTKYSDPYFDLDDKWHCLESLTTGRPNQPVTDDEGNQLPMDDDASSIVLFTGDKPWPPCVKRVGAIFEKPQFYIGGPPNVTDTRQGAEGDCWFLSSIGSLCIDDEDRRLVERLCPPKARDEKVGVYGFVFYRDGEWISEVIDDKLYLRVADYDDCTDLERDAWDRKGSRMEPAAKRREFRKEFQTGSDALYYGSCSDPNETWVPLLEKAFAKAHGDYNAIAGGYPGEGLEDITGGVTTKIISADILDLDELWTEGFMQVNKEFLFGAGTRAYSGQEDWGGKGRQGIQDGHAYSVLKVAEYKDNRLLLVKNPWGKSEWTGPWSDGSKEWTPDALTELDHQFGDDGIFWMTYEDFLDRFNEVWRTRLFNKDWKVTQKWTTIQVPWTGDYNPTKFQFTIAEPTRAVIVLSKLDERYFKGLDGAYAHNMSFRLHATGEEVHLVRGYSSGSRSASVELDLEAGSYDVLLHISATRYKGYPKVEDVVTQNWEHRRAKLIQIGTSYDLAQAKGQIERPAKEKPAATEEEEAEAETKENEEAPAETTVTPPTPPAEEDDTSATKDEGLGAAEGEEPAPAPEPNPDPAPAPASVAPAPSEAAAEEEEAEEDKSPKIWNCTLVVGLRVFCDKSSAEINVITPQSEAAIQAAKEDCKLDVDHPEKDMAEDHSNAGASEYEDVDDEEVEEESVEDDQ